MDLLKKPQGFFPIIPPFIVSLFSSNEMSVFKCIFHLCWTQAIIKDQLQETNGMCEYAIYVQGEPRVSWSTPLSTD